MKEAALLILDLQGYFLEEQSHAFVPTAKAMIPNIEKLVSVFENEGRPIVATAHLNTPENAGSMARWWKEILTPEHPLSSLTSWLSHSAISIIEKTQYDAFFKTNLDAYLRRANVQQVFITGILTHLCCETTARSAFVRGYDVFFGIDSTATYTKAFHEATLLNISHGFGVPFWTEEVLRGSEQL